MNILTSGNSYQGTFEVGTVITDPHFQICATANISADNRFECSFWINRNGERVDSNLGNASYRIRDKAGALVSGFSSSSITPDINGYFHITPVSAVLLTDLSHFLLEIEIPVEGIERSSTIGLVNGE